MSHNASRQFACFTLLFAAIILFSSFPTYAQIDNATFYQGGECGADGGVSFYAPNCEATGIFSEFICSYESIVSQVLSETYCTMVDTMAEPLAAMLTLFVAFWGIMLLTGQTPFTARDGFMMLFKFAFVYAAATEAEFTLRYLYNGVMGILQGGVIVILEAISSTTLSGGGSILASIDEVADGVVNQFALAQNAAPGAGGNEDCSGAVLAMSLMFLASAPAVTMLAFMMIFKLAMVAIKTVFAYLLALTGIMFLITMVPIFASFLLFKATAGMFDMWVKYMLSFALQIVIVFAFIGFVIELEVIEDFAELLDLAAPYEITKGMTGYRLGMQYCTICKGLYSGTDGTLGCGAYTSSTETVLDPDGAPVLDDDGTPRTRTVYNEALNPDGTYDFTTGAKVGTDPTEPIALVDVLALLGGRFAYLLIMAYILETVLRKAPEIAVTISQARFAPKLGSSIEHRFQNIGNGIANGVSSALNR